MIVVSLSLSDSDSLSLGVVRDTVSGESYCLLTVPLAIHSTPLMLTAPHVLSVHYQ